MTPIEKAIEHIGGQAALAKRLGITTQAVHLWVQKGKVPADRALKVQEITGISCHDLRPDVFGPAPDNGKAA